MRDATKRRITSGGSRRKAGLLTTGVLAVLAVTLAGCTGESAPTEPGADVPFPELYQEALDGGGTVVLYTHLSGATEQAAIADAFQGTFPGMTLEVTGLNGQQLLERFLTEKRAGQNLADVIEYAGLSPFLNEFNDEGFIEPYKPSSAGDYTTEGTYIDGVAYPWTSYEQGACYNPDLVTDEELEILQTYEGWADPIWNGRAAMSEPSGGTYLRGWTYWIAQDPDLGEEWLREIKENVEPIIFSNGNAAADRVAAGEYAVAYGVNSVTAVRAAMDGAPLQCARQEYTVIIPAPVGLVSDAPNPAGGKLFIEWQLSEEGQRAAMNATGNLSARDDLVGVAPDGVSNWSTPNATVATDEGVVASEQRRVVDLIQSLFGTGQ